MVVTEVVDGHARMWPTVHPLQGILLQMLYLLLLYRFLLLVLHLLRWISKVTGNDQVHINMVSKDHCLSSGCALAASVDLFGSMVVAYLALGLIVGP
jgi:hypothetical protein